MESTKSGEEYNKPFALTLPHKSLIVLCGPAGSGKSTFATQLVRCYADLGWKPTMVVSSDQCRALICDDEANQQVNRDTFDLFYYIINKRLFQQRTTIADSTALLPDARQRLLDLARQHHYHSCLLVFNCAEETCRRRNLSRQRQVDPQVIPYHIGLLHQALKAVSQESWSEFHILDEQKLNRPVSKTFSSHDPRP